MRRPFPSGMVRYSSNDTTKKGRRISTGRMIKLFRANASRGWTWQDRARIELADLWATSAAGAFSLPMRDRKPRVHA